MTKPPRRSLRASMPSVADEAATAMAHAEELLRLQAPAAPAVPAVLAVPMTTSTIHLPVELLGVLRAAANRRTDRKMRDDPRGRGGRPSVSEIVVELLTKHREEIDNLD